MPISSDRQLTLANIFARLMPANTMLRSPPCVGTNRPANKRLMKEPSKPRKKDIITGADCLLKIIIFSRLLLCSSRPNSSSESLSPESEAVSEPFLSVFSLTGCILVVDMLCVLLFLARSVSVAEASGFNVRPSTTGSSSVS